MKKQPRRRTFASSHFFFKCIIVASWNNNKLPVLTMVSSKNRICKSSHFRSVLFSTAVDYSIRTVGSYGFRRVLPAWIQQWRQIWSFIIYHQTASLIIGIRTFHISNENVQRFSFSWYLEKSFNWYLEIFFRLDLKARTTTGQRSDFVHQGQRDVSPIEQLFGRHVISLRDVVRWKKRCHF